MNVVAIIQARMGSTRLPGKILKKVNDKTLLEYQIERVRNSKLINKIVIATTVHETDKPIVDLCDKLSIDYFRGSEHDVLSRYYNAAIKYDADVIVRLTSDCPLIDPEVIDKVIQYYLNKAESIDYVSNTLKRTYPRGLDVEVFSMQTLADSFTKAELERDREHVTAYIYTNPDLFRLSHVEHNENLSHYRWTVDTQEDFELISKILEVIYPMNKDFLLNDVHQLLKKNPEWNKINVEIEQKKI